MPQTKKQFAEAEARVDAWNKAHEVGEPVIVTRDDNTEEHTKTRSVASNLYGRAVIFVEGIAGCYLLSRIRPDAQEDLQVLERDQPKRRCSLAGIIAASAAKNAPGAECFDADTGEKIEPTEAEVEAVNFQPLDTPLTTGEVVREIGPPPRKKNTPVQALEAAKKALKRAKSARSKADSRIRRWTRAVKAREKALKAHREASAPWPKSKPVRTRRDLLEACRRTPGYTVGDLGDLGTSLSNGDRSLVIDAKGKIRRVNALFAHAITVRHAAKYLGLRPAPTPKRKKK